MSDEKLVTDLKAASELEKIDDEHAALLIEAAERIDELLGEVEDANEEAAEARSEIEDMEGDDSFAREIYEAIVERRTDDAVELLARAFNTNFIRPTVYQSMFRERVKNG